MPTSGNSVLKSYRSHAVSEGLLKKVVEAITVGETDARSTGQIRTFEVFIRGHRQNIVVGQVMVIPAKIADTPEQFPSALLNGALVREVSPEALADLMTYKLGNEQDVYDEFPKSDLSEIKDQLFKDVDGKYRSIVLFIPAWANPRDYVIFKFTKDEVHLSMLVRHLIFAAYFDPALSNAFEQLATDLDTRSFDVTDITPKMPFPHLSQNILTQYPQLDKAEAADVKLAGARKPKIVFAKGTVQEAMNDLLEPGERAVIDALTEELKENVDEAELEGDDFVKSAADADANAKPQLDSIREAFDLIQDFQIHGEEDPQLIQKAMHLLEMFDGETSLDEKQTRALSSAQKHLGLYIDYEDSEGLARAYTELEDILTDNYTPWADQKTSAETGLRSRPDYGEEGSHTQEANEAASKDASAKTAGPDTKYDWGMAEVDGEWHWTIEASGLMAKKIVGQGQASSQIKARGDMMAKLNELQQRDENTYTPESGRGGLSQSKAAAALPKKAFMVQLHNEHEILAADGAKLMESENLRHKDRTLFVAVAEDGFMEEVVFDGSRVVYEHPDKFPPSFRIAVEKFFKQPKKASQRVQSRLLSNPRTKKADVPLSFAEIWNDVTEDLGGAPLIELSGTDGASGKTSPNDGVEGVKEDKAKTKEEPKSESKSEEPKRETAEPSKKDESSPSKEESPKEDKTEEAEPKSRMQRLREMRGLGGDGKPNQLDKESKTAAMRCDVCGKTLTEGTKGWSETSPNKFNHDKCVQMKKEAYANSLTVVPVLSSFYPDVLKLAGKESIRTASFNMFEPGQVLTEFRPELQRDIVDYPSDTYSPLISDVGPEVPTGASTSPGALGIGNNGQSQVLEGVPLRKENDIRGFGFNDEFHQQREMLNPGSLRAASCIQPMNKRAGAEEYRAQLADFLKKVVGELAATFIAAFKVTSRPMMNKVPGVGEVQLAQVEQQQNLSAFNIVNTGSRVKWLLSKLNDGDIKDAINAAWAQAAVWSDSPDGGFNYEVFVRPSALDTDSMILSYEYVCGTKGL